MALTTELYAAIKTKKTSSPDGGNVVSNLALSFSDTLESGTSNGQADRAWRDDRSLSSAANEELDLAGSLVDELGATLTFVEVTTIMIVSAAANTTDLTIGGATAEFQAFFAAAGDKLVLKPGGVLFIHNPAGWAVGAGSTDDLLITNGSGAAANYSIAVVGRSA